MVLRQDLIRSAEELLDAQRQHVRLRALSTSITAAAVICSMLMLMLFALAALYLDRVPMAQTLLVVAGCLGGAMALLALFVPVARLRLRAQRKLMERDPVGFGLVAVGGFRGVPAGALHQLENPDPRSASEFAGASDRNRVPEAVASAEALEHSLQEWLAGQLTTPHEWLTFRALLPEFEGTLGELVEVSRVLSA